MDTALAPVLHSHTQVYLKQLREMGEALTGLEGANKYVITTSSGTQLGKAVERKGGAGAFFIRIFMKAARPFTIDLTDTAGKAWAVVERPFKFGRAELSVKSPSGALMGKVRQARAFFAARYILEDSKGTELVQLKNSFFSKRNFKVYRAGKEVGLIQKKRKGLLKALISDADNFSVDFDAGASELERVLLVGAAFMLDFRHFETK